MTHLICAVFSWYGIELDDPVGRHDGTVQGVRYFAATDNHGVFATESKLQKVHHQQAPPSSSKKAMATSKSLDILDSHRAASCSSPEQPVGHASPSNGQVSAEEKLTFSMNYHTLATNEDPSSTPGSTPGKPKARRPLRRSLSAQHRAIKVGHHTLTSPSQPTTIREANRGARALPNFQNHKRKCVFNKRTIKVFVSCS